MAVVNELMYISRVENPMNTSNESQHDITGLGPGKPRFKPLLSHKVQWMILDQSPPLIA